MLTWFPATPLCIHRHNPDPLIIRQNDKHLKMEPSSSLMRTEVGFGLSHEHYPYFRIVEIYRLNTRFFVKWPLDVEKLGPLGISMSLIFFCLIQQNTTELNR